MGKKYVIEIEDRNFINGKGGHLWRVKGFNSLVFDQNGLDKLTPLDEIEKDGEAIPVSWIKEYYNDLNDRGGFARLDALTIGIMVKKWREKNR